MWSELRASPDPSRSDRAASSESAPAPPWCSAPRAHRADASARTPAAPPRTRTTSLPRSPCARAKPRALTPLARSPADPPATLALPGEGLPPRSFAGTRASPTYGILSPMSRSFVCGSTAFGRQPAALGHRGHVPVSGIERERGRWGRSVQGLALHLTHADRRSIDRLDGPPIVERKPVLAFTAAAKKIALVRRDSCRLGGMGRLRAWTEPS